MGGGGKIWDSANEREKARQRNGALLVLTSENTKRSGKTSWFAKGRSLGQKAQKNTSAGSDMFGSTVTRKHLTECSPEMWGTVNIDNRRGERVGVALMVWQDAHRKTGSMVLRVKEREKMGKRMEKGNTIKRNGMQWKKNEQRNWTGSTK